MKKRYSEEQIIGFLRKAESGIKVKDLCRRHGFSEASYYARHSKRNKPLRYLMGSPAEKTGCLFRQFHRDFCIANINHLGRWVNKPGITVPMTLCLN